MKWLIGLLSLLLTVFGIIPLSIGEIERSMMGTEKTIERLKEHLRTLTLTIGERSVFVPANLKRTARYIESIYQNIGMPVRRESYQYRDLFVDNVVAEISFCDNPSKSYLPGAHYDTVTGIVGADDNASARNHHLPALWITLFVCDIIIFPYEIISTVQASKS